MSDRAVKAAIADGAATIRQLARVTAAGTDCGTCVCALKRMLTERRSSSATVRLLAAAATVVG